MADIPWMERPLLTGLFTTFEAPFFDLNNSDPKLFAAGLNGDSCPIGAALRVGETTAALTPVFNGETLNPEVPAFRPGEAVSLEP